MSKLKKHPDLGKRVSFTEDGKTYYGKLLAVTPTAGYTYLVQREDEESGWTSVKGMVIKAGIKNCWGVGKYKLTGKHTHRFNMCSCGKER